MTSLTTFLAGCALAIVCSAFFKRRKLQQALPLPPGPPKLPIIGNLLDLPSSEEWLTYERWSKEYGSDIIHVDAAGTSLILLNSQKAVTDLFEKRSTNYSGRKQFVMLNEMIGWNKNFAFKDYTESWRMQRKLFVRELHPAQLPRFFPIQQYQTHLMLADLLEKPDTLPQSLRLWAASVIMMLTYGIDVLREDDPYIHSTERAMDGVSKAAMPGAFLVDSLPFLRYVPEWILPQGGFQKKAREWRRDTHKMAHAPFDETKRAMASGKHIPSFTSYALEGIDPSQDVVEQERDICETAHAMYTGGSDTVVTYLCGVFLWLLMYPDVQSRAREELIAYFGPGVLPTMQDFSLHFDDFTGQASLPYLTALLKEVFRFRPNAPLSVPHTSTADDVYEGYFIPAGAICVANTWAILHDPEVYGKDAHEFKPERFLLPSGKLNPDVKDPIPPAFGYGRRACPGRGMGLSLAWIAIASILVTFDIKKDVDTEGKEIEPSCVYGGGIAIQPLPYAYKLVPRKGMAEAVRSAEGGATRELTSGGEC